MLFSNSAISERVNASSRRLRLIPVCTLLMGLLALTSCGHPTHFSRSDFDGKLQCAPYAREKTGVALRGRASSWWTQARGRYARTQRPSKNALLVFRSTSRIPSGHISIVRKIVSSRKILVEHANWEPGAIDKNVPVIDISKRNNWNLVRVYWKPIHRMGTGRYATYGFILPN
ncbi:MAG: CHAP domain-containing protein [Acetobacteraceae bacterium]